MEHNLWSNYFDTLVPGELAGRVVVEEEEEEEEERGWEG